jgi:hypothetical protein
MEDPVAGFELSTEQRDTARLLHDLLGQAIAARYEDFCRLSSGSTDLNVSKPMAAHALRELDSILRIVLAIPLEAVPVEEPGHQQKIGAARRELAALKFDQNAINRAITALAPRTNHKDQIRKIVGRLGLDPRGEIANQWVSLIDNVGNAHGRSFHLSLKVDDDFRQTFQQPFDMVIRAVVVALRSQYAALMRRVAALATSTEYARDARAFRAEIPGALPLQRHFFNSLTTGKWLPFLVKERLLGEPLEVLPETAGEGLSYLEWPAGNYLLRMAKSSDATTRSDVVDALRMVAESDNPDIRQKGVAILAALPPDESALLVDLAVAWMRRAENSSYLPDHDRLIKRLANAKQPEAALRVAREFFRLWGEDRIESHHPQGMYEHFLPELVTLLTAACGKDALQMFVDLLHQAAAASNTASHGYLPSGSVADNSISSYGIFEALLVAVRRSAETLIHGILVSVRDIITIFAREPDKIFVRLALYVLAQDPSSAPDLATSYLLNGEYIEPSWCRHEYALLALAWFPSLSADEQDDLLRTADAFPDKHLVRWRVRFEEHNQRAPTIDDELGFRTALVTEILWEWRAVLSAARQAALEKSGDPNAWMRSITAQDETPVVEGNLFDRSVDEIVAFLRDWEPASELHRQTVTGLAQRLHSAVFAKPQPYAADADSFMSVKRIFIRQMMDGLRYAAGNRVEFEWPGVLRLIAYVFSKAGQSIDPSTLLDGDDPSWDWTVKAAGKLLVSGLQLGKSGISEKQGDELRSLVMTALSLTPNTIDVEDFEERFNQQLYATAQETSRGIVVNLCLLLVSWRIDHTEGLGSQPLAAFAARPDIARALELQLADRTPDGRIPRAIMGRYLRWMYHCDKVWVRSQMSAIFPIDDPALRDAAWRSHLMNDGGPIGELMPELEACYSEEIARLSSHGEETARDRQDNRRTRFASYVMVLVLLDFMPEPLLESFHRHAAPGVRRRAMWFVGEEISRPAADVSDEVRRRGLAYWETRLTAATASGKASDYAEELGAISQWCYRGVVDELWLCSQLLAITKIGIAPGDGHGVIDWLQKVSTRHLDRAVEVLLGIIKAPQAERWIFMTSQGGIYAILSEGRSGTPETIERVREAVSYLASLGQTGYLDLDPSGPH